jgi:hypothetical protein
MNLKENRLINKNNEKPDFMEMYFCDNWWYPGRNCEEITADLTGGGNGSSEGPGNMDKMADFFSDFYSDTKVGWEQLTGSTGRGFSSVGNFLDLNYTKAFGYDYPEPLVELSQFKDYWHYYDFHEKRYDELYMGKKNESEPLRVILNSLLTQQAADNERIKALSKKTDTLQVGIDSKATRQNLFNTIPGGTPMYNVIQQEEIDPLLKSKTDSQEESERLTGLKAYLADTDVLGSGYDHKMTMEEAIKTVKAQMAPYIVEMENYMENREGARYWKEKVKKPDSEPQEEVTTVTYDELDIDSSDVDQSEVTPDYSLDIDASEEDPKPSAPEGGLEMDTGWF